VIGLNRAMRERLWERVAGMPGRAPKGIPIKKPNAQWIKPGLVGHVRFLKGEGGLRHATLTDVRDED
jgi:ATP-dependent DNA ligase